MCTVKRLLNLIAGVAALSLLLAACGPSPQQKMENLKKDTDALAQQINAVFVAEKEALLKRADIFKNAFEHPEQYDLSTKGMDVSEGGGYTWFEDLLYYPTRDLFPGLGMANFYNGLYLDPEVAFVRENYAQGRKIAKDGPEIELIKRDIKLLTQILPALKEAGKSLQDRGVKEYYYIALPSKWVQIISFYYDYVSSVAPGLTMEIMRTLEWCYLGLPEGNPEGKPFWTKEAFAGMSGEGWLETTVVSVYVQGKYLGFVNGNMFPLSISDQFIKTHAQKMLFLGSSTSLLGISKPAKEALKLAELTDFDYVSMLKDNPKIGDDYKLTSSKQPTEIQALGQAVLAGKTQFEQSINGKTYLVVISPIPEVKFYVVGLVEK